MAGNALYIQSGGPTAVINATAYGVISRWRETESGKLYAALHGLHGVARGLLLDCADISGKDLELLPFTPGMHFGSTRYKISLDNEFACEYENIISALKRHDIRHIFFNGGNGSLRACRELEEVLNKSNYVCGVVFIPKTVDNDIKKIDHSPGFPSAARHVNISLCELARDLLTYDSGLIMVVEVMGRMAGWVAASSIVARKKCGYPNLVYVPESPFSVSSFIDDIRRACEKDGKCMAVVAEGVKDENNRFLFEYNAVQNLNPELNMGGITPYLKRQLANVFECKIRTIDLGLMQRCAAHTVSELDRSESIALGREAVSIALKGESGKVVAAFRRSSSPYVSEIRAIDMSADLYGNRTMPQSYISRERNGIDSSYLEYIEPLIGSLPEYSRPILS